MFYRITQNTIRKIDFKASKSYSTISNIDSGISKINVAISKAGFVISKTAIAQIKHLSTYRLTAEEIRETEASLELK